MSRHGRDNGQLSIGVDIGGTKIAAGLIDGAGNIVARERLHSPADDDEAIVGAIVEVVNALDNEGRVEHVGIAAAGFIDPTRSRVVFAPNLAWQDEPLREVLQVRCGKSVVVENDANAAAWGEFSFGAGKDVEDFLLVTVGTGVGGGVVVGGSLLRGGCGMAAEVGHLRLVPQGEQCGCGNRGCLEAYGSGSALVRVTQARAIAAPHLAGDLLARAGGEVAKIDGPMITEAAMAGDRFSIERLADLGSWLGLGIANMAAVLDPRVVVVGGGVCAAGDLLLDPLRAAYSDALSGSRYRPDVVVRVAALGNDAGIIGAADLARRFPIEPNSKSTA